MPNHKKIFQVNNESVQLPFGDFNVPIHVIEDSLEP